MHNFSFHNPTNIVFGEGQISALRNLLPTQAKILLLYGGGSIKKNGVYDQVVHALEGKTFWEFAGIQPNPQYETLLQAVALIKQQQIDFLLAVGGGSVIDAAKFIAGAVNFAGDPWNILAKHARIKSALPIGCVLTLPATGSESNGNSVISKAASQEKLSFYSPLVYPQFAILDPATTYSLPWRQVANGVVDAFVHIMEQYLTYPVNAKVQDRFAEGLLLTLIEEGPKLASAPHDYATRANIMWAATMALNGLIGAGVPQDWATHALGHEITALHGLDHAQTLAIVLPALMQQQRAQKREKIIQYGKRVWNLSGSDEEQLIDAAIAATQNFFAAMGVPTRLSSYGLNGESIATLVANLTAHNNLPIGENRNIDAQIAEDILTAAI
ncbi:MAG TPA: iron-containing alcohol dehydrogenase [Cellvibrio sp.]|nr:iron-containing alcohol dehydrogenase [Cellvibrio sp.]